MGAVLSWGIGVLGYWRVGVLGPEDPTVSDRDGGVGMLACWCRSLAMIIG